MFLPSLLTTGILIGALVSSTLSFTIRRPDAALNIPALLNSTRLHRHPLDETIRWPRAPWTFSGLKQDGRIEFEYYGRHFLHFDSFSRMIHADMSGVRQLLQDNFHSQPVSQPRSYDYGAVRFTLQLEPHARRAASAYEIFDMFWWLVVLVRRYEEVLVEIGGALLWVEGEVKAYFSLAYPAIK